MTGDYWVLEATPSRLNRYETYYFDTPDLALYHQHHNDHGNRYKIRCRRYVDSDQQFLEVKFKSNQKRTIKFRQPTGDIPQDLAGAAARFVNAHFNMAAEALTGSVWNRFSRITLVNKTSPERLTLDVGYRYGWRDAQNHLPGVAIVEVKQPRFSFRSPFIQQMRRRGIRRSGFSKYCISIMDLYPNVKRNRFKRRLLHLQRLSTTFSIQQRGMR